MTHRLKYYSVALLAIEMKILCMSKIETVTNAFIAFYLALDEWFVITHHKMKYIRHTCTLLYIYKNKLFYVNILSIVDIL